MSLWSLSLIMRFLEINLCVNMIQLCYNNFTSRLLIMNCVSFHFLCFGEMHWNRGRNSTWLICTWSWNINTSFMKPSLLEDFHSLRKRTFIQRIWAWPRYVEPPLLFLFAVETVGGSLGFVEAVVGIILSRVWISVGGKNLILLISDFPKFCIFL